MEPKIRFTAARSEYGSNALTPRIVEELPRLQHSADDAAYMDWLNTFLQNGVNARVDDVPTDTARRAMEKS